MLQEFVRKASRSEFTQHYWQESFDGDSFVSQSRFDAYAASKEHKQIKILTTNMQRNNR